MEVMDVWIVAALGSTCVHRSYEDALQTIRGLTEELADGQTVEIRVVKGQMTAAEVEALPDFEGY